MTMLNKVPTNTFISQALYIQFQLRGAENYLAVQFDLRTLTNRNRNYLQYSQNEKGGLCRNV